MLHAASMVLANNSLLMFFPFLEINMFFHQMFWQQDQPTKSSPAVKVNCWETMILILDMIMDRAPEFNKTGLVGFPINVILNWPMATTAGFAAFLNDKVLKYQVVLKYIMEGGGEGGDGLEACPLRKVSA